MQLRSIQAMRAVAALAVMFAHLHGIEARLSGESPVLAAAWIAGVSGVDLFFVISGFVMVWVAGDATPGARTSARFLFARVTRIYPLWWLFAGCMALYFLATYGQPWDAENLARFDLSGSEHLWKSFLLIPHDAFPILSLGWTLMHEMYFYLVFALLLLLPSRFRMSACILWALIIVASISAQLTGFYASTVMELILFPMTLEFLMGAAVAWMVKSGRTKLRWVALILGCACLFVAFKTVNFSDTSALLATSRTFSYGPAFALLLYAAVSFELNGRLGRYIPDVFVHIGDWSYSLYLGHLLVIAAVGRVFFDTFGQDGQIDNAIYLILASLSAVAVAGLTYHLFERPMLNVARRTRKAWFDPPNNSLPSPAERVVQATENVKD